MVDGTQYHLQYLERVGYAEHCAPNIQGWS